MFVRRKSRIENLEKFRTTTNSKPTESLPQKNVCIVQIHKRGLGLHVLWSKRVEFPSPRRGSAAGCCRCTPTRWRARRASTPSTSSGRCGSTSWTSRSPCPARAPGQGSPAFCDRRHGSGRSRRPKGVPSSRLGPIGRKHAVHNPVFEAHRTVFHHSWFLLRCGMIVLL